jgi:hypothetical protein
MKAALSRKTKALLMAILIGFCPGCLSAKRETVIVMVNPGKPGLVAQKVKARIKIGDNDSVEQEIGGWVVMPPEHWERIKEKLKEENKEEGK